MTRLYETGRVTEDRRLLIEMIDQGTNTVRSVTAHDLEGAQMTKLEEIALAIFRKAFEGGMFEGTDFSDPAGEIEWETMSAKERELALGWARVALEVAREPILREIRRAKGGPKDMAGPGFQNGVSVAARSVAEFIDKLLK